MNIERRKEILSGAYDALNQLVSDNTRSVSSNGMALTRSSIPELRSLITEYESEIAKDEFTLAGGDPLFGLSVEMGFRSNRG